MRKRQYEGLFRVFHTVSIDTNKISCEWTGQYYDFACRSVWVWNSISHFERSRWTGGVWE